MYLAVTQSCSGLIKVLFRSALFAQLARHLLSIDAAIRHKIGQFGWLARDIYLLQYSGIPGGSQITCCHGLLHSTTEGARKREPVPYPPTLEQQPEMASGGRHRIMASLST